mgnify:CR=1 FL=1
MNAVKLAIVWILVIVPLTWGVVKSVQKSLPLFQMEKPV